MRFVVLFISTFIVGAAALAAEPPSVAFAPEILRQRSPSGESVAKRGGALAELTRTALAADPRWTFVERADLAAIENEQTLAAGQSDARIGDLLLGRLVHADWTLSLVLIADQPAKPRVAAEVIDTRRADILARAEVPTPRLPNESWILSPPAEAFEPALAAAQAALQAALEKRVRIAGRVVAAPLGFVNRSGTDRLAPVAKALRETLFAQAGRPDCPVHMLPLDAVGETLDESFLVQAGLVDFSSRDWERVADVFVWIELRETDQPPQRAEDVRIEAVLRPQGNRGGRVLVSGRRDRPAELAEKASAAIIAALAQARSENPPALAPEDRKTLARNFMIAAHDIGVEHDDGPAGRRRLAEVARLIELAAFFAPDDRYYRELRIQVGQRAAADPASDYWSAEFGRLMDHFLFDQHGRLDLGLLERSDHFRLLTPGATQRYLRLAKALRGARPKPTPGLQRFAERLLRELVSTTPADGRAIFEAMWPALRPWLDEPGDWTDRIVGGLYADARTFGHSFLAQSLDTRRVDPETETTVSTDPWADLSRPIVRSGRSSQPAAIPVATDKTGPLVARSAPPSADRAPAPSPRARSAPAASAASKPTPPEAFTIPPPRWIWQGDRFVEPPAESLDKLPELETAWISFFPDQIARTSVASSASPVDAASDSDGLWFMESYPGFAPGRREVFRFDTIRHEITGAERFGPMPASPSALRVAEERIWLGTRGDGLRLWESGTRAARSIKSTDGLLRDDVLRLEIGRDAAFADATEGPEWSGFLSEIPFDSAATPRAVAADANPALEGLPHALRAAIASYGSNTPPRVRLPETPGVSKWAGDRANPPPQDQNPGAPLACRGSLGDGYWVSDGSALAWAAGNRLINVARWTSARVVALADDGRHLFAAVGITPRPTPDRPTSFLRPGALRIYVYDHREGKWRGHLRAPNHFAGMGATRSELLLISGRPLTDRQLVTAINTAKLFPPSPTAGARFSPAPDADLFALIRAGDTGKLDAALRAKADPDAATGSGWTPLMAAVWADNLACARRLLAAGARTEAADLRGWHPLLLAAAWSSPEMVTLLLEHGAKVDFQPSPIEGLPDDAQPALRTALHAAAQSGRAENIELLLRAGAAPAPRDRHGLTPFQLAFAQAPAAVVRRLLAAGAMDADSRRAIVPALRPELKVEIEAATLTKDAPLESPLKEVVGKPAAKPPETEPRVLSDPAADPLEGSPSALERALDVNDFPLVARLIEQTRGPKRAETSGASVAASTHPNALPPGLRVLRGLLQKQQAALANRLLDKGVAPSPTLIATDADEPPLLLLAVVGGDATTVRTLRRLGFFVPRSSHGDHPVLSAAFRRRDAAVFSALLEAPAVDAAKAKDWISGRLASPHGDNLLFAAISDDWPEGVAALVAAGARTHAHDGTGNTPAELVRAKPSLAVALNARPGAPDNTLEGAAALHLVSLLGKTLSPADITPAVSRYRDSTGETVLIAAARRGDNALVRALLDAGADAKAATEGAGETALTAGIVACDDATIERLLAAGAPVDGPPGAEVAPLHIAAHGGSAARVKRLLAAGASPDLRTPHRGLTPVQSAAYAPHDLSALQALVDTGKVDLAVRDENGFGLLEMAVVSDTPEKIQYLLDHGVRWRKSPEEWHPMDAAASQGRTGSIRKLLELGLRSPRAFSLAKDDATRALLANDTTSEIRRAIDDELSWPDILRDRENGLARAKAHLAAGGNVNHASAKWGNPLKFAVWQDDAALVRLLVEHGADPAYDPGAYSTSEEATYLAAWIGRLPERLNMSDERFTLSREKIEEVALGYLTVFWDREASPKTRSFMLRSAFEARLPRLTARMVALGASTRWARDSLSGAKDLSAEDRKRWNEILGARP